MRLRQLSGDAVVAIVSGRVPQPALDELQRQYRVVAPTGKATVATCLEGAASVVVFSADGAPQELPRVLVWGTPVSGTGRATDEQILSGVRDPSALRSFGGRFILIEAAEDRIRAVTSSSLAQTLVAVAGEDRTAWSTKGLAAHLLAGVRPELNADAVLDQVLFDYVLGTDELLAGSRVLDEATVVDVTAAGIDEWSWWPRAERFERATASATDDDLLRVVGDVAARFAAVPGAMLGLTGGRDSGVIVEALLRRGDRIHTFTLGNDAMPDVVLARARARQLGWPHDTIGAQDAADDGDPMARLLRWSRWSEGMETPTNYLGGWPAWGGRRLSWVTGHGGEIGRAFYWGASPPTSQRDAPSIVLGRNGAGLPPAARAALEARIRAALEPLADDGAPIESVLDRFYALQRMRKWVGRLQPSPEVVGALPVYLEPGVVDVLLRLPADDRRTGAAFDRILGRPPATPPSVVRRAVRRARGLAGRRPAPDPRRAAEVEVLRGCAAELRAGSIVRQVAGDSYIDALLAAADHDSHARRLAWNAIGVDAFRALIPDG